MERKIQRQTKNIIISYRRVINMNEINLTTHDRKSQFADLNKNGENSEFTSIYAIINESFDKKYPQKQPNSQNIINEKSWQQGSRMNSMGFQTDKLTFN